MTKTKKEKREMGGIEHMVLSNSVTLVALVELLDDKDIIKTRELLERIKRVRNKATPE